MRFSCRSVVAALHADSRELAGFLSFSCAGDVVRCSTIVYRNDKSEIRRQRTRTGARSLRRCASSQTGISDPRKKNFAPHKRTPQNRNRPFRPQDVPRTARFHRQIGLTCLINRSTDSVIMAWCARRPRRAAGLLYARRGTSSERERCSCHSFSW